MKNISFILMVFAMLSNGACANVSLVGSEPSNDERIDVLPDNIVLMFSGLVRLSGLNVINNEDDLPVSAFMLSSRLCNRFEIPFSELPYGQYTIKWIVVDTQDNRVEGEIQFTYVDANDEPIK